MHEGNRGLYFAAGGLAALALLWLGNLGVSLVRDYPERQREEYQAETSGKADAGNSGVETYCVELPRQKARACVTKPPNSKAEEERAEKDLRAQQQMAQWAFAMVIASLGAMGLSVAGLAFVGWGLRINAQGNAQQRLFFAQERRAWLDVSFVVSEATFHNATFWFSVKLIAKNVGSSPATNVFFEIPDRPQRVFTNVELAALKGQIAAHKLVPHDTGETVFQTGERERTAIVRVTLNHMVELVGADYTVPAFVSYGIAFDQARHVTPVVIRVHVTDYEVGKGVTVVADYNPLSVAPD